MLGSLLTQKNNVGLEIGYMYWGRLIGLSGTRSQWDKYYMAASI